jgi:hypothetical protein
LTNDALFGDVPDQASCTITAILVLYVVTSLTIPFWVPILKRFTGDCGVFWVFSVLTYYAYLAWVIFALLLALLIYRVPIAGLLWTAIVLLRIFNFWRLGSRSPGRLRSLRGVDEEATLPYAVDHNAMPTPTVGSAGRAGVHGLPCSSAGVAPAVTVSAGATGCGGGFGCSEGIALGNVLLVGNGPSIRDRGLGCAIDGFDTVVRFNSFVTKGLEEHTGSKTSLWCHMMQWYHISTVEVCAAPALGCPCPPSR